MLLAWLSPAILFFHGNGEIAAHYDVIAPFYTERDTTLVVDYRGNDLLWLGRDAYMDAIEQLVT